MSYDGRAVANFILDACHEGGREVTNLSLQKIAFFCHAWSLVNLGRPLIKHRFEAWEFGPVLPYLYRDFRSFGDQPIRSKAKRINPQTGTLETVPYKFDYDTDQLLRKVVKFYSLLRAGDLVELTHAEGGPWFRIWNHKSVAKPGMQIDDASIEAFYRKVRAPFTLQ